MNFIKSLKENKFLLIAFSVLVLTNIAHFFVKPSDSTSVETADDTDTVIPKGYVLIPVELQNFEAISGVIQNFGVVDLYSNNPETLKSKKIASKIKLIRAPYNPNSFAVLAKEEYSEEVVKFSGNLYAVIQNKKITDEMKIINSQKNQNIAIEYQKETSHD